MTNKEKNKRFKIVRIREDVYALIEKMRGPGESFSALFAKHLGVAYERSKKKKKT